MNRQQGGALAAAGVVAVSGGSHLAAYGHLFPFFKKTHHIEIPEGVHQGGDELLKHCLREAAVDKPCLELPE